MIITLDGQEYDCESFHPTAFEDNIYTVRFHYRGKKWLDIYTLSTNVYAHNELQAIGKAIKDLF